MATFPYKETSRSASLLQHNTHNLHPQKRLPIRTTKPSPQLPLPRTIKSTTLPLLKFYAQSRLTPGYELVTMAEDKQPQRLLVPDIPPPEPAGRPPPPSAYAGFPPNLVVGVVGPGFDAPRESFGPPPLSPYADEPDAIQPNLIPEPPKSKLVRETLISCGPVFRGWNHIADFIDGMTAAHAKEWWDRGQYWRRRVTGGWDWVEEGICLAMWADNVSITDIATEFRRTEYQVRRFGKVHLKAAHPEAITKRASEAQRAVHARRAAEGGG